MTLAMDAATEARFGSQWVLGLVVVLSAFFAMAESTDRLSISPTGADELLIEEIYDSATEWRKPPLYESEWRAEKPKQESRIRFGYDSAYEEMAARDFSNTPEASSNIGGTRANMQFRVEF